MSLLGRMFGTPPAEPDPMQGAADEMLANDPHALVEVTPEQIEAEKQRESIAYYREWMEFHAGEAARYEAKGETVKAALERQRANDERIRMERAQARLVELTGEVA